jgi:separase
VSRIENETSPREKLLQWPVIAKESSDKPYSLTWIQFQEDFVDILPRAWTAVSISLNDAEDELLLTRYRTGQSPFILRLPMARHKSRDLDEEIFDFHAGKREMLEIIELANFSAHDARHMSVKGAKTQWWAEREALDKRLAELLVNIENIWLGGFRGVFAQQRREQNALVKFQKELQKILSRHLPSRQGRSQGKPLAFDSRIIELFTGLGDPSAEEIDLDEPLMDLMYFVVDILQFNGEKCAYDEIDFDSVSFLIIIAYK